MKIPSDPHFHPKPERLKENTNTDPLNSVARLISEYWNNSRREVFKHVPPQK